MTRRYWGRGLEPGGTCSRGLACGMVPWARTAGSGSGKGGEGGGVNGVASMVNGVHREKDREKGKARASDAMDTS